MLVTGSTIGIGLGIARAFAEYGTNIILNGFGDMAETSKQQGDGFLDGIVVHEGD